MDKSDYDSKVQAMIEEGPYIECKYKNSKSKNQLSSMIEVARECADMISEIYNDPWLKRRLLIPNPKIATLYALPKIHKNPIAMRPIASNICTPMEKMAQMMLEIAERYPIKHGFSVKSNSRKRCSLLA